MSKALDVYADHADALITRYDAVTAEQVLAPVADLLPPPPAPCLDVGPGSGRDAAWLAARGHPVIAAEPIARVRAAIATRAPTATLVDARLPELDGVAGSFRVILANLVWHHLSPEARDIALARLVDLLGPAGRLFLCLRNGPAMPERDVWALEAGAEITRATAAGLDLLRQTEAPPRNAEEAEAGITATWLAFERRTG